MGKSSLDVKSLVIGFLLGLCILLAAAQVQGPSRYQIATASSTWIIDKGTGDVWQLNGEYNTNKYVWTYAGRPAGRDQSFQGTGP
jgi:hypothetical protein